VKAGLSSSESGYFFCDPKISVVEAKTINLTLCDIQD
jgi:hypothetical protein